MRYIALSMFAQEVTEEPRPTVVMRKGGRRGEEEYEFERSQGQRQDSDWLLYDLVRI